MSYTSLPELLSSYNLSTDRTSAAPTPLAGANPIAATPAGGTASPFVARTVTPECYSISLFGSGAHHADA